jgi:mannose-6-phosphate isomerase
MTIGAFCVARRYESRLWGGTQMATWLGVTDAPTQFAESWQVYNDNTITTGQYRGMTLRALVARHQAALVGARSYARYGDDFPLLAKFIDAGQALSVQVHPDDSYAHTHEAHTGFHGKTEAWYIIGAEPHSDVIHGLNAPLTRDTYATAIADGTLTQLLRHVPIHAGDTIDVPAGTIHAINAGVFLFEIQQTSDLTYRVYDYLRRDDQGNLRTLHIPQALAVSYLDNNRPARSTPVVLGSGHEELVRSAYFVMERITSAHAQHWTRNADSFEILTLIDGACVLTDAQGTHSLQRGDSIIIPADSPPYHMAPSNSATWLRCWVPDA